MLYGKNVNPTGAFPAGRFYQPRTEALFWKPARMVFAARGCALPTASAGGAA